MPLVQLGRRISKKWLRSSRTGGQQQHVVSPASNLSASLFRSGAIFDAGHGPLMANNERRAFTMRSSSDKVDFVDVRSSQSIF